ncbi:hypothetical protein HUT18_25490 [Streptomyces sp. NA04227]|uniref:hypothetical protein n=1 Tax=Streptomyces sp. NA04227 TaxID=2742136 RepID=UPI001590ED3F|nr:hypothetical protein [Streptomyces sp. NA04227]QKW09236.1 hypothetical protein HUT18_25490 [Streptomyces sp. NA04227]
MEYGCPAGEFLGHEEHGGKDTEQGAEGLLDLDWDEHADVAVRVHLLDRWLREDDPAAPTVLTRLCTDQKDTSLTPDTLTRCGLFPLTAPGGGARREVRECRPVTVPEAAALLEQALLEQTFLEQVLLDQTSLEEAPSEQALPARDLTPSHRVALLAADLRETLVSTGQEAAVVTVADPVTGEVVAGETHVVVSTTAWSTPLVRISVMPRTEEGAPVNPACSLAACADGVRLAPGAYPLAERRVRAVCAGTVLASLLECDGRGAFRVGWQPHGLAPGRHLDLASVRAWWATTTWYERYDEDHIDLQYDYGAGDWLGRHSFLAPTPEELDDESGDLGDQGMKHLALGDPATEQENGVWMIGEGLRPLQPAALLDELDAFAAACAQQAGAGAELVEHLLAELLFGPVASVGGPERRLSVWADSDDNGAFWRAEDGTIDIDDDARRLLVVGPEQALYLVFRGDLGA